MQAEKEKGIQAEQHVFSEKPRGCGQPQAGRSPRGPRKTDRETGETAGQKHVPGPWGQGNPEKGYWEAR